MTEENEYFKSLNIHQRMMNFLLLINNEEVVKNDLLFKIYKIKPYKHILKDGFNSFLKRFPTYKKSEKFNDIINKLYLHYKKNGISNDVDITNITYMVSYYTELEMYERCHVLSKLKKK